MAAKPKSGRPGLNAAPGPETKGKTGVAAERPFGRADWLAGLLLAAAIFLVYQQVWRAGFVWDDNAHVTGPELRSLHGLWKIWFEPGATQQYYPVLHSAFWLEHRVWGEAASGYHLANIFLHSAVVFLLYAVLRRLAVPGALFGAAAFAFHPVCVESVAWVSEQKNTLSAVFYLAAALTYFRFARERRPGWYAVATALFALALASKSVTATLPAALLVVQWWRNGRISWQEDVRPLVPWFLLAAGAAVTTVWMERSFIGAQGAAFALSLADRVLVAGRAVWFYLGKLVWPADLIFIYPRWNVDDRAVWQYVFPLAAAAFLAAFWTIRKRARGPLAAALLFAGTLFPALGFINVYPFIYSYVADHFQYLAAAMMISAAAAGLTLAVDRLPARHRRPAKVAAFGAVAVLAGLTWIQGATYADAETLWRATLARNPGCWMACDNLGDLYLRKGRVGPAVALFQAALVSRPDDDFALNNLGSVLLHQGQIEQAAARFEDALHLNSDNAEAHNNLGLARLELGETRQASAEFQRALTLKERYPTAHYNLGLAWLQVGQAADALREFRRAVELEPDNAEMHNRLGLVLGATDEARAQFERAIQLNGEFAEAHFDLGNLLLQGGRVAQAVAEFRRALEINPKNAPVHVSLAHALLQGSQVGEAVAQFRMALALAPADAETNNDLGAVLIEEGRVDDAVAQFRRSIAIDDNYAEAHSNLANVFLQRGEAGEAVPHYRKALATEPRNARVHNNLGLALLQTGQVGEAAAQFQQALEIQPDYPQARRNLEAARAQGR